MQVIKEGKKMVEDSKKEIKLYVKDAEFGNEYTYEEKSSSYEQFHIEFARVINNFMKMMGYSYDNDLVFLESLTEEEYDYLLDCLWDYRDNKEKEEKEETD